MTLPPFLPASSFGDLGQFPPPSLPEHCISLRPQSLYSRFVFVAARVWGRNELRRTTKRQNQPPSSSLRLPLRLRKNPSVLVIQTRRLMRHDFLVGASFGCLLASTGPLDGATHSSELIFQGPENCRLDSMQERKGDRLLDVELATRALVS